MDPREGRQVLQGHRYDNCRGTSTNEKLCIILYLGKSSKDFNLFLVHPVFFTWKTPHIIFTGYYDIADVDDNDKKHFVPEAQVLALHHNCDVIKRLGKGEDILAVYPDTTSFYPAIVATSLKKVAGTDTMGVQVLI